MAEKEKPYTLRDDEKATPVMLYTAHFLAWGDLVTKEQIRVNTYLRTIAPDYVSLFDVGALLTHGGDPKRPMAFRELHLRTPQILALHLTPPAEEPVDYDEAEANRTMEPITAMIGPFRFDGLLRISTLTDLQKHLEISREVYTTVYEVEVSHQTLPSLGTLRTSQVLLRTDAVLFASRS
jgi:hypothetical protein